MSTRIMLVDDDPLFLQLGGDLLRRESWHVEPFTSAEAAIDAMAFESADLLITDIQMPGMDGMELTRYFVANHPGIPVIIFTGTGNEQTAIECFRLGAVDYIRKEFIKTELYNCVSRVFEESAPPGAVTVTSSVEAVVSNHGYAGRDLNRVASNLDDEYIVRRWGSTIGSQYSERRQDREFCEAKLRILRRQVERLDKWVSLDRSYDPHQKRKRHSLSDVVHMMPLTHHGSARVDERFAVFCRDVSAEGCLVIRNGMFQEKEWAIYFPHLGSISPRSACVKAKVIGGSPIPLGMYEIGLSFDGLIKLSAEDEALMRPRKCS